MEKQISQELKKRNPLIKPAWLWTLRRMREHEDAPRWNIEIGDRITTDDLAFIRNYGEALRGPRSWSPNVPPEHILQWIRDLAPGVPWFRRALSGRDPGEDFGSIPVMERRHLQQELAHILPPDMPLDRLIVNPTSGTTGHPIPAPNHPRAVGCYDPLIGLALERHGLRPHFDHTRIAAIQVCFQRDTIVYNTVHSVLEGAGFAKVNLSPDQWPREESPARYIADMEPFFISGDPIAFMEMMERRIDYRPGAILSTALSLTPELRRDLESRYACPVVDFYSLNETGPLACSCPEDPGHFHVLPHDLYLEIIDDSGRPVPFGTEGDICVTGGRNPFLPLLRYRTGDRGLFLPPGHTCPEGSPALKLARSRQPVLFTTPSGRRINPIDISRIMRRYPVTRHRCTQHADLSLTAEVIPGDAFLFRDALSRELEKLFHNEVDIRLVETIEFPGKEFLSYIKEK